MLYFSLLTIGHLFLRLENFEIAIDYLQYCLEILKNLSLSNDICCASLYFEIGDACNKIEKYENALKNYQKSLDLSREIYGNYNYLVIAHILDRIISLVIRMNH